MAEKKFDIANIRMKLRQAYVLNDDAPSRKRRGAFKGINALLEGAQ